MATEPLPAGSPFPTISPTTTSVWVDFWNIAWKSWIENFHGSSSGGWPASFTGNGRITTTLQDNILPRKMLSPALSLILPEGLRLLLSGEEIVLEEDVVLADLPQNFTGWIKPVREYDGASESYIWDFVSYAQRPERGTGVVAKITTTSADVSTISATVADTDVIPTLPVLLQYLGSESDSGSVSSPDLSSKVSQLEAELSQLRADFENLKTQVLDDSVVGAPSSSSTLMLNSAKQIAVLTSLSPTSAAHFKAGIDAPGLTGYSQNWNGKTAPLVRVGGNAEYDEARGVIR